MDIYTLNVLFPTLELGLLSGETGIYVLSRNDNTNESIICIVDIVS